MAPKTTHDPQYLDPDHQRISEFAADYFDDDDERTAFVDTLMERRGYSRTSGWSLPEPEQGPGRHARPAGPKRPAYFRS